MFNEILRETRKLKGLSQYEMADLLHISRTAYGDYERGRTEPDIKTLKLISSALNVSVDYLLEINSNEYTAIKKSDVDLIYSAISKYIKK